MNNLLIKAVIATVILPLSMAGCLQMSVKHNSEKGVGSYVKYAGFPQEKLWLDDEGNPINAHGGGFLFHEGTYYWFGEYIKATPEKSVRMGFNCYSSKDLYNWHREGQCFDPKTIPAKDIPEGVIINRPERPKVIYNKKTGKFVMWFHMEDEKYKTARSAVAIADKVTGPYTYLKSFRPNAEYWPMNVQPKDLKPVNPNWLSQYFGGSGNKNVIPDSVSALSRDFKNGQVARDMTIFQDDDGSAYHIYSSEDNSTLHISKLTDDYLSYSGHYIRVFPFRYNEAPAMTKRYGNYYLLSSDCSGYSPNAARSAISPSIWGPWKELDNPATGICSWNGLGPEKTFGGQSTYIFKVEGKKDAYIAMFDVWNPQEKGEEYGYYFWLPINFTDKGFKIPWMDEWNLSYFDTIR